jgi:hypothetical protein
VSALTDKAAGGERRPSTILTYHTVAPERSRYVYSVTCNQLEEHLKMVAECHGETPHVTFDDGRISDYEFGLPLLEKHRIRATFFVTAGLIEKELGFMSWQQVRAIASAGHAVQSHGWSHMLLNRASETDLRQELEWSKKELEDRLGLPIVSLSLPGGRWSSAVLNACAKAGYQVVYHSDPWKPPAHLQGVGFCGRLMVRNTMNSERMQRLLAGNTTELFWLRTQHTFKEAVKRLIGDTQYHRLWRGIGSLARKADVSQRKVRPTV